MEFRQNVRKLLGTAPVESSEIDTCFAALDVDRSGEMDHDEVKQALSSLSEAAARAETHEDGLRAAGELYRQRAARAQRAGEATAAAEAAAAELQGAAQSHAHGAHRSRWMQCTACTTETAAPCVPQAPPPRASARSWAR